MKIVLSLMFCTGLAASSVLTAQVSAPDPDSAQSAPAAQPVPPYQRPVSVGQIIPNIVDDQAKIFLFPAKLNKKRNWIPTAVILGTTAALIALDSHDAPYFRRTSTFSGFNSGFSGNATAIGTAIVPLSLYATGLIAKDTKMKGTALLAGEAVADSEILAFVLKDAFKRVRPASLSPTANFSDTWFDSRGSLLNSNGGMPSGHTIAAFSVATVVARRYGNHRWVPYVSYGLASLVGFSRLALGALRFRCVRWCGAWLFRQPAWRPATVNRLLLVTVTVVVDVSGCLGLRLRLGTQCNRILRMRRSRLRLGLRGTLNGCGYRRAGGNWTDHVRFDSCSTYRLLCRKFQSINAALTNAPV
jgi:membrane-associated phospholipid phosphatase